MEPQNNAQIPDAPRWKSYHSYIPEEPVKQPEKKKQKTALFGFIMIFELLVIIVLVFYILVFTEIKNSSFYAIQNILPDSIKNMSIIAQAFDDHTGENSNQQTSAYRSVYSDAVDESRDLKRKADLQAIATAVHTYSAEFGGVPDGFPRSDRCIGTHPTCYDLYTILVPQYLDSPRMDPLGTIENSGYSMYISQDDGSFIILHAVGEDGNTIEVIK